LCGRYRSRCSTLSWFMRVVCPAPGGYLEPQSRGVCQFALPTWPPVETLNLVREHDTDHRQSRRDRDLEGIALTLTGDWAHQCKADLRIVCSGGSTTARRLACSWSACGVREIQTTSPRPGTLERRPATSLSPRGFPHQLRHGECVCDPRERVLGTLRRVRNRRNDDLSIHHRGTLGKRLPR